MGCCPVHGDDTGLDDGVECMCWSEGVLDIDDDGRCAGGDDTAVRVFCSNIACWSQR